MWAVMKLTLNLYNTTDDTRVVNKAVTTIAVVNAEPTDNISVLSPAFMIEYNNSYFSANYCYCAVLGRYYYIRNMSLVKGNRILIECSVDVLKTYAAALTDCDCIVTRSESIANPTEIPDKNLPIDPNREDVYSILFDHDPFNIDFNSNSVKCWQLTTNGGGINGN